MSDKPSNRPDKPTFRPITSGLGFHPFSDGLPYAPVSPPRAPLPTRPAHLSGPSAPTGASLAGRPRIAPAAAQRKAKAAPAPVQIQQPALQKPVLQQSRVPAPGSELIQSRSLLFVVKRCFAYGFDQLFATSFCVLALVVVLLRQPLDLRPLVSNPVVLAAAVFFFFGLNWILIAAQEVAFGTSAGKKLFGLRLTGSGGAIFTRAIFFLFSVSLLGFGLVWAFFNPQRRCWHDLATGSEPIEVASLW